MIRNSELQFNYYSFYFKRYSKFNRNLGVNAVTDRNTFTVIAE